MKRWLIYIIILAVQLVCYVLFHHDPFFGDAISSTYQAANHIYQHNLLTIFYPIHADPGHPTLYSWLLAAAWKLFGQNLSVTHAYSTIWMLLFSFQYIKTARVLLNTNESILATVLLVCFGTYLSLSALVLNTTTLMFFALISFYGLHAQKNNWLLIGNVLMVLTHLQGVFFVVGYFAADAYLNVIKSKIKPLDFLRFRMVYYVVPALFFSGWLFVHTAHAGWAIHSPHYVDSQSVKGVFTMLKSTALVAWRMVDYGMLPIYTVVIWGIKKRYLNTRFSSIFLLLFVTNAFFMVLFLEHTIGHRYFFVFHALAIVLFVDVIRRVSARSYYWISCITLASVIGGNFLYYPGKTLGDATLAYRSYFELEKQISETVADSIKLYSYAPLANTLESRYLAQKGLVINRIHPDSIFLYDAILQSNLNAEFDTHTRDFLTKNWVGNSYESGSVYVNVFLNPQKYNRPQGWKLRTPTVIENQLLRIKSAFKKQ